MEYPGATVPAGRLPSYPRLPRRFREKYQEERLQKLKQWRENRARELGIEAGILANNALLEALSEEMGEAVHVPMKRWQRELFGTELLDLLRAR